MKKLILPIAFLASLLSCKPSGKLTRSVVNSPVIAHRGAFKANHFPENSIASLKHAIQLNCFGSEFDVWMTADDSLVVNHDPKFHNLEIEKTDFKTLQQFQLSNGEALPTLRNYLRAGLENNPSTQLILEIKPSNISKERGQIVAAKVVEMVLAEKAGHRTAYISFDFDMLVKIRSLLKKAHLQYLNGDKSPAEVRAAGLDGLDYHFSVFQKNPEWIDQAKSLGLKLNAWTVNDTAIMNWLLDKKFDFITTNEPEQLHAIVNERISKK